MRFLAFSHNLNSTHGLAFLILVLAWLRLWGVETLVTFQSDWGQEFGGDNPQRVEELSQRFLAPWGGALRRYPVGRKGYNGRVERRHRTDDEEFYRPYLLQAQDVPQLGYTGDVRIALFPPVLLDVISTDLLLACDPETGNDLLAHYTF